MLGNADICAVASTAPVTPTTTNGVAAPTLAEPTSVLTLRHPKSEHAAAIKAAHACCLSLNAFAREAVQEKVARTLAEGRPIHGA